MRLSHVLDYARTVDDQSTCSYAALRELFLVRFQVCGFSAIARGTCRIYGHVMFPLRVWFQAVKNTAPVGIGIGRNSPQR